MSDNLYEVEPFNNTFNLLNGVGLPSSPVQIGPFRTTGYERDGRLLFSPGDSRVHEQRDWSGVLFWSPDAEEVRGSYWAMSADPAHGIAVMRDRSMDTVHVDTAAVRGLHFVSTPNEARIGFGQVAYGDGWEFDAQPVVGPHAEEVLHIAASNIDVFAAARYEYELVPDDYEI